jgi:hypothetical protein
MENLRSPDAYGLSGMSNSRRPAAGTAAVKKSLRSATKRAWPRSSGWLMPL